MSPIYDLSSCRPHCTEFLRGMWLQEIFKSVNSIKGPDELQMNCFILMSEWGNKELQFPAGLFPSHSTLINISQPARMVCYLNLMNFCTEWIASNWQSVIKQKRREYKSPANTKEGTNTGKERKKVNPGAHCTWQGWGAQGNRRNESLYVDTGGRLLLGVLGLVKAPIGDLSFHGR